MLTKTVYTSLCKLLSGPRIQQRHTAIPGEGAPDLPYGTDFTRPFTIVFNHKSRHIDPGPWRGVRRRIGQVQFLQLHPAQPRTDGGGQHVNAFIHPVIAYDLGTQQAAAPLLKDHLHGHQLSTGVISCVAHRRENDRIRLNSKSLGRGLIDSGNGGGEIKDLDHAAALGAGIPAIAPADVIGSNAPLLVGRTGQSDQRILPGYKNV